MENCNDYDGLGVKEMVTCFCVGVNSMKRLPWARRFSVINIAWTNAFFALLLLLLLLHLSLPLSSNASSTSHRALKMEMLDCYGPRCHCTTFERPSDFELVAAMKIWENKHLAQFASSNKVYQILLGLGLGVSVHNYRWFGPNARSRKRAFKLRRTIK